MSYNDGNSNAKSPAGNGSGSRTLGGYKDAARVEFVLIPRGGGFQGHVRTKDAKPNSFSNAYGEGGSSSSRSQGLFQQNQRRPSMNPYRPSNARGTGGYVLDGPMKTRPTISRPSYAQGYTART